MNRDHSRHPEVNRPIDLDRSQLETEVTTTLRKIEESRRIPAQNTDTLELLKIRIATLGQRQFSKQEFQQVLQSRLFDPVFYLQQNREIGSVGSKQLLRHWLGRGWREQLSPSVWFDQSYYLANNADVHAARLNPLLHYLRHGWHENRKPHVLFEPDWYLSHAPDVQLADQEPLTHYATSGHSEGRSPSIWFDASWYSERYSISQSQAFAHFSLLSKVCACSPTPYFDANWYLERYADVAASGADPFKHFLQFGAAEGRDPSPWFDSKWYGRRNPGSGKNSLLHYLLREDRATVDPSPWFSVEEYRARHKNMEQAQTDAFRHFLISGRHEPLRPNYVTAPLIQSVCESKRRTAAARNHDEKSAIFGLEVDDRSMQIYKDKFVEFDKAFDILLDHVNRKAPFSLVRLGDGENSVLAYPEYVSKEQYDWVIDRALGSHPYLAEDHICMRNALEVAIRSADLIGTYPATNPKLLMSCTIPLLKKRGVYGGQPLPRAWVNYDWQEHKLLLPILQGRKIGLIGCRDIRQALREKAGIDVTVFFSVPEEHQYKETASSDQLQVRHFPDVFHHIDDCLRVEFPGQIFLIGAGHLGKYYCHLVKQGGGIAIDVGSLLDKWAGLTTRGIHKQENAEQWDL